MEHRVSLFIDGPNVPRWVDVVRLYERLVSGRQGAPSFYYHSDHLARPDLTDYPDLLDNLNLAIRIVPRGKKKRERVDVELSVDLVDFAHKGAFDVSIVVSGDGDFRYPISKVWGTGKAVEVAARRRSVSQELLAASSVFYDLDAHRRYINRRSRAL